MQSKRNHSKYRVCSLLTFGLIVLLQCVYESHGTRSYHFVRKHFLQRILDQGQHLDRSVTDETPGGSSSQTSSLPDADELDGSSTLAIPEHRIAVLESRVNSLSNLLSSLHNSSSGGTSPAPLASAENEQTSPISSSGYLSQQGGGRVRYINESSWNAMCRDASEIDDILFSQSSGTSDYEGDVTPPDVSALRLASTVSGTGAPTTSDIPIQPESQTWSGLLYSFWDELPSRDFCDEALKWYFRGYHPLVPLVHVPSFRQDYEQFWNSLRADNQNRMNLLSLTTTILSFVYAGVVVSREQQHLTLPNLSVLETTSRLHRLISRALKLARFPHAPTLDTLRAYMIQQSIRLKAEEPLTSLAFVGLSLRAANILGLHKDPKHFPQLDMIVGEVRRRIWWQLVHIDVCIAVNAGLPPLIDWHGWDVQPIAELKDDLIGTANGVEYEKDIKEGKRFPDSADNPCNVSGTSLVSTTGILAASKYRFTRTYHIEIVSARILRQLRSRTVVQREFLLQVETGSIVGSTQALLMKVDRIGTDLQEAIDRIPDSTRDEVVEADLDSAYGSSLILNRWARLLISTYYDQRLSLISYAIPGVPRQQSLNDIHAQ